MSVKVLNDFMDDFGHRKDIDKKFYLLRAYKKLKESL